MLRVAVALLVLLIPSVARAETRLALVISNASYPAEIGRLENPHRDGAVIAAALETVGFERRNITVLKDADPMMPCSAESSSDVTAGSSATTMRFILLRHAILAAGFAPEYRRGAHNRLMATGRP
jgi:hypothetical protein